MAAAVKQVRNDNRASSGNGGVKLIDWMAQNAPKQKAAAKPAKDYSGDYDDIVSRAEETGTPDAMKYSYAVSLAQDDLGDDADPDDMREAIDGYFAEMNPTQTGEQFRGEDNLFSQFGRGARNLVDDAVGFGGDVIDGAWDTVMGGLGDLVGDKAGDYLRDMFDDEDAEIAANVLLDAGLTAIPVVGPALSLGKNLAQNSENIYEAVSGRDDITGQELTLPERIGSAGLAALSVLPAAGGVGRTASALKTSAAAKAGDEAAKTVKSLMGSKAAISNVVNGAKNIPSIAGDTMETAAGNLSAIGKQDGFLANLKQVPKSLGDLKNTIGSGTHAAVSGLNPTQGYLANDYFRNAVDDNIGSGIVENLADKAAVSLRDAAKNGGMSGVMGNLGNKAKSSLIDMGSGLLSNAGTMATGAYMGGLRAGYSPLDFTGAMNVMGGEDGEDWMKNMANMFLLSHVPGSAMRGRPGVTGKQVNTTGRYLNPMTNPAQANRIGAVANRVSDRASNPGTETTTDMMRRYLLGGDEDGEDAE